VLQAGTALRRLMMIVAQRVLVGEPLEQRRVAALHVVKSHRSAAAFIGLRAGKGRCNKRIKIAETAARVVFSCVFDPAIRLLPHLVEPMHRVAGVGIIGKPRAGQLMARSAMRRSP
jgi:hypothetical protein